MKYQLKEVAGSQPVRFDVLKDDETTLAGVSYPQAVKHITNTATDADEIEEMALGFVPMLKSLKDYLEELQFLGDEE